METEQVLESLTENNWEPGAVIHVTGASGSGKTFLIRKFIENLAKTSSRAEESRPSPFWTAAIVLTADRQRAETMEKTFSPGLVASLAAPGAHRPIRSINSFAYLVLSQWLVERADPQGLPPFTTGADEDLWLVQYLQTHAATWSQLLEVPENVLVESPQIRKEFRDVLDRLGQYGLRASQIAELGRASAKTTWSALAQVFQDYAGDGEEAYSLDSPHKDSARLPAIAAKIIEEWAVRADAEGVKARCPIPEWLIVDGAQDFTPNLISLIGALRAAGSRVLITSDPSTSTGTYRGSVPNLGAVIAKKFEATSIELEGQHRMPRAVTAAYSVVSAWTGSRPANQTVTAEGGAATVCLSPNFTQQTRQLADLLKLQHYGAGIPWQEMAVIVRASDDIEPLRRALKRAEIPLGHSGRPVHFASVPVCSVLLSLLVPDTETDQHDLALDLLLGPLIGLDKLALYQALRQEEGTPQEVLLSWLTGQLPLPDDVETTTRETLTRAKAIWTARAVAQTESAQLGLWRLWNAAAVAQSWQIEALEGSWGGEEADSRLDAVMALFRKADLWEQQQAVETTDLSASRFAAEVLQEEVSSDTIAQVGLRASGVAVLTATQSAGRHWNTVCVVGLQESTWPTNSVGMGLLQASLLTDLLAEALEEGWDPTVHDAEGNRPAPNEYLDPGRLNQQTRWSDLRATHLENEARLLAAAISRSCHTVHFSVVENEEERGSIFVDYLCKAGILPELHDKDGKPLYTPAVPDFSLDSLIGQLRAVMARTDRKNEVFAQSAKMIAFLCGQGVSTANPQYWVGEQLPEDQRTVVPDGEKIRLSPSHLERAQKCLLQWFYSTIAVQDTVGILTDVEVGAAQIGSLIHQLAQEYPKGPGSKLTEAFETMWADLKLDDSWWTRKEYERVERMLDLMAAYFTTVPGEVETEVAIKMELPNSQIYGRIDRIEHDSQTGAVHIADIKTSKTKPTQKDVQANVQLQAYQLALAAQGMQVEGASLITVGAPGIKQQKDAVKRSQESLDAQQREELAAEFDQISVSMRGPNYRPAPGSYCDQCPYRRICPAQPDSIRETE